MGHIHGHLVLHSGYQSWQGKGRNGWGGLVDCYPYTIIHCQWIIKESRFPVNNRLLITWIMYRFRNHVTYHVFQSIILFNVVFFIIKWNHVSCSRFAGNGIVLIVRPYQTSQNIVSTVVIWLRTGVDPSQSQGWVLVSQSLTDHPHPFCVSTFFHFWHR